MAGMDNDFPEYLVLDGAMGSQVQLRVQLVRADPLWSSRASITHENVIKDIHRDYLQAGADVLMTNTYKPRLENLKRELSLDTEGAREILRSITRSACDVRDKFYSENEGRTRPLVVGAMGPFGAALPDGTDYAGLYVDSTSEAEFDMVIFDKARALWEGGADLLGFETIPAIKEAESVLRVLSNIPGAKAWLVFCCKDGEHICHGEKFKDATLMTLHTDAIVGVGVNCSKPEYVTSLLREIPDVVKEKKKIVVYSNNGQLYNNKIRKWIGDEDTKPLSTYVAEWLENGANWIGGCCNVDPMQIAEIRTEMDIFLDRR